MAGLMIINFTLSKKLIIEKYGWILTSLFRKLMTNTTGKIFKATEIKMLNKMKRMIKPWTPMDSKLVKFSICLHNLAKNKLTKTSTLITWVLIHIMMKDHWIIQIIS